MSDVASQDLGGEAAVDAPEAISGVRRHRSELKAAMNAFEDAVAGAADESGEWLSSVAERLEVLITAFGHHVAVHEGPDSFHAEVLRAQPHLSSRITALQRDHRRLEQALSGLSGAVRAPATAGHEVVDDVRGRAADVLHRLSAHRRHGADLVWEAFNADLGGEH